MTINNMDQYIKSLWDWAFLDKCFRYGIKVTDIDGCVERKHNLLFLETKLPKVKIPYGQQRLFTNLAMYHHVIIIWGEKNIPEKVKLMGIELFGRDKTIKPCNIGDIQYNIKKWFEWADKNPFCDRYEYIGKDI